MPVNMKNAIFSLSNLELPLVSHVDDRSSGFISHHRRRMRRGMDNWWPSTPGECDHSFRIFSVHKKSSIKKISGKFPMKAATGMTHCDAFFCFSFLFAYERRKGVEMTEKEDSKHGKL